MHKVFISYHHANDQIYKDVLVSLYGSGDNKIFIDGSVDTGDISDSLSDQEIREKIRDEYLKDTSVTVVLFGIETKNRKHVDWEIYSSMYDGKINKKSGIIIILLPDANPGSHYRVAHESEKETIYPEQKDWITIDKRSELEKRHPFLSDRIIDNLLNNNCKISILPWSKVNRENLRFEINAAFDDKENCEYDLSRSMKRNNS